MRKEKLAFIDLETTGLDLSKHEIIEIGCVITTSDLENLEEIELKIKPERIEDADPTSLKINRYKPEDWIFAYTLNEAMKIFSDRAKGCIMVAHNIAFDAPFLDRAFAKTGIENTMHYHKLDTISVAWAKLHRHPEIDHFSLRELCAHFGIKNENAHTALSDARATAELYKKLMAL